MGSIFPPAVQFLARGWLKLALLAVFCCFFLAGAGAGTAQAKLQCVPYARDASNIKIRGNAWTWWGQAAKKYRRGSRPAAGAVMVMSKTRRLRYGHVAVVRAVLSSREILVDHANWLNRGRIHRNSRVKDVSRNNDWSIVKVWYGPGNVWGRRSYPIYGFIYDGGRPAPTKAPTMTRVASAVPVRTPARKPAGLTQTASVARSRASARPLPDLPVRRPQMAEVSTSAEDQAVTVAELPALPVPRPESQDAEQKPVEQPQTEGGDSPTLPAPRPQLAEVAAKEPETAEPETAESGPEAEIPNPEPPEAGATETDATQPEVKETKIAGLDQAEPESPEKTDADAGEPTEGAGDIPDEPVLADRQDEAGSRDETAVAVLTEDVPAESPVATIAGPALPMPRPDLAQKPDLPAVRPELAGKTPDPAKEEEAEPAVASAVAVADSEAGISEQSGAVPAAAALPGSRKGGARGDVAETLLASLPEGDRLAMTETATGPEKQMEETREEERRDEEEEDIAEMPELPALRPGIPEQEAGARQSSAPAFRGVRLPAAKPVMLR